jgi:two-component system, OmpR family, phosphate regulon sensor histidine kinase PhoR
MWPILLLLAVAGVIAVHLYWRRRFEAAAGQARREVAAAVAEKEAFQKRIAGEEAQQRALFDSMVEGVLVLDGEGRVRLANRALTGLFNLPGDIRGRTVMEAIRSHELQELVRRAQAEGAVLNAELELPGLKDRLFQVNATSISPGEGQPRGMLLVFHDLTLLKQLENTRREFVANVSHELRTPLSMIKGYVETLVEGGWQDAEVAPRFLQIIQKHVDRLTFLIEDLLTISRLESGQISMTLQPVELQPVASRVLEDLRKPAAAREVRLVNDIPSGFMVTADADRLEQVFSNLVENAIKYGRADGTVTVRVVTAPENKACCSVEDDGPGIPAEALDRVFERFYRVDRARTRDAGGTGLGLAIVKHIVQAHGGEVWAESETGKGSKFFFTLPLG